MRKVKTHTFNNVKYKLGDLIIITWLDAVENPAWQSVDKAATEPLAKCVSVGWFLNKDKKAIRISATVCFDSSRNVNVIPVKWVEKIIKISTKRIKLI